MSDRGEWYQRDRETAEERGLSNERERDGHLQRSTKQLLITQKTNKELRETHTLFLTQISKASGGKITAFTGQPSVWQEFEHV